MRQDAEALEGSRDQLAVLVLRLIAEHSPCAKSYLLSRVTGADPDDGANASASHAQGLICDALRKLKSLGFVEFAQEEIEITNDGRLFLEGSLAESPSSLQQSSKLILPIWLAQCVPRVRSYLARAGEVAAPAWKFCSRAKEGALQTWQQKVAPKIGPARAALSGLLWSVAEGGRRTAKAGILVLEKRRRQLAPLLSKSAQAVRSTQAKLSKSARAGLPKSTQAKLSRTAQALKSAQARLSKSADAKLPKAAQPTSLTTRKPARYRREMSPEVSLGGALVLVIIVAGAVGWSWNRQGEHAAPATQIASTEAAITTPIEKPKDPVVTGSITPGNIEQPPLAGDDASPSEVTPPTEVTPPAAEAPSPADPVVAAILTTLKDASIRPRAHSEDLAALESFYAKHNDAPVWMSDAGFSAKAKAIIGEIENATDWGLPQDAFDLPAAGDAPATPEAKAEDEVKLDLAILKYARFARGGRVSPARISPIFDQKAHLRDPTIVLDEIEASAEPDAFLRSLHPKQQQFEQLRQALIKARADSKAKGRKPESDATVQRLVVNMERWRWMPPDLGSYYVWNNIPSFSVRVISGGKSVYTEKAVVGQLKYATPVFSAEMRSIVFSPDWTVPDTIIREDLAPRLRQGGLFGPDTSVLSEHGLRVSYQGRPIDPDSIDWGRANIFQYTFIQAPGEANVLGKLKFNFPNKHAIYMHDTVQPEFFNETVRALSHGCIRVREPDRLAQLLLARDKNWSGQQVQALLAKGNNSVVTLNRPVPVHLTYFTAVVDEQGKVQTLGDIYGLDSRMAAALFDKGVKFGMPAPTVEAKADRAPQPRRRSYRDGGGIAEAMSGLFGN
jgi:L,D-transpeptidase YcbB